MFWKNNPSSCQEPIQKPLQASWAERGILHGPVTEAAAATWCLQRMQVMLLTHYPSDIASQYHTSLWEDVSYTNLQTDKLKTNWLFLYIAKHVGIIQHIVSTITVYPLHDWTYDWPVHHHSSFMGWAFDNLKD